MKRLIILLLVLTMIPLSACGKNSTDRSVSEIAPAVKINLPKDDTVNGYRTVTEEKIANGSMPNKISADEVTVSTSGKTDENDANTLNYCANKSSKVFHKSSCGSVSAMKDDNKYFADRQSLISEGYKPCGRCKP